MVSKNSESVKGSLAEGNAYMKRGRLGESGALLIKLFSGKTV